MEALRRWAWKWGAFWRGILDGTPVSGWFSRRPFSVPAMGDVNGEG